MSSPTKPERSDEVKALQARLRAAERDRSSLVALIIALFVAVLLNRAGDRVWALAVFDPASSGYIEVAYLPQFEQAELVYERLIDRARQSHPYYKSAPEAFAEADPRTDHHLDVRRVRRVVSLAPEAAADAPVDAALAAIQPMVTVVVNAWAIYDVDKSRALVVLPTQQMAEQAKDTRLENVNREVRANLSGTDHLELYTEPTFLQTIELRQVTAPVSQVMTVAQAVDYLGRGERKEDTHTKQAEETVETIAAKYNTTVPELVEWNGGRDLRRLETGEQLIVRKPQPPLTVLTVERRNYVRENPDKPGTKERVTVEIRRHDGQKIEDNIIERAPVK